MNYDPTKQMTREEALVSQQPVCVIIGSDGKPDGVLVQALGEKFIIEPKDFNDEMQWYEAIYALKASGKTTFTNKQAHLAFFLKEHINVALSSIEGETLIGSHWVAPEYDSYLAWCIDFYSGRFVDAYKYDVRYVRAIINL